MSRLSPFRNPLAFSLFFTFSRFCACKGKETSGESAPMKTETQLTKKSVKELSALGYNLKAYSSGGDLLVQSFIAIKNGQRIHAWFSHKSGVYEIEPSR